MATIRCTLKELQAGLAVPLDESTKIVVVPAAAMVTLLGRVFDSGKSFMLPRAIAQMAEVFALAVRTQAKRGLIVGHTNPGDADPETLSAERAAMAQAWLEGKADVWVANYDEGVEEAKRWGAREDRLMLSAVLPRPNGDAPADAKSDDPVTRFQSLHAKDLAVDGIIGPKTRTKLVEEYFALSRTAQVVGAQPEDGPGPLPTEFASHGAAANFSLAQVEEAKRAARQRRTETSKANQSNTKENNRAESSAPQGDAPAERASSAAAPDDEPAQPDARVDLLLFAAEAAIEPAPGAADGPEYLELVAQAERFQNFVVPGAGADTQLSMQLMDKSGFALHKGAKYEITGPERLSGVTDSQGKLDHDDVLPGDYELKLTLEFFADPDKNAPRDKIVTEYTSPVVVLAGDRQPQVRMLGAVPRCKLVRIGGLLFETNKAFVLPEAIQQLKNVRSIYEQNEPSKLLVVGHTDTTAGASINDPLSLKRAKATLAYLEDDADTWLGFYGSSMRESERWGEAEDRHMRSTLLSEGISAPPDMKRLDLIKAYMRLDGEELDSGKFDIEGSAHGCGENFPVDDGGEELDSSPENDKEDALDRRVEFFFFDAELGIVPKPEGENSKRGSKQYPAWRELADLVADDVVGVTPSEVFVLLDREGQPMPGAICRVVELDLSLVADEEGVVRIPLPPACGETLELEWAAKDTPERFEHHIAAFLDCGEESNPNDQHRLHNLGYTSDVSFDAAVALFQRDQEVDHTPEPLGLVGDELPPATKARLDEIYGVDGVAS